MERTFDLKQCNDCSAATFRAKFGMIPRFTELEQVFHGVRQSDKRISYAQLAKLKDRKYWNFEDYWYLPNWWAIRKALKKTAGIFRNLPEGEKETIAILYSIFKNIEVVSIIMRFVEPDNYGIISPPVRSALNKRAQENYVDEYLDYLNTLRAYSSEFSFIRVADADIALWSLVEKCVNGERADCANFKKYQERLVEVEEQLIKTSSTYHSLEDEILEVAEKDIAEKEAEIVRLKDSLAGLQTKISDMPQNLIKIEKSALEPSQKLIHDGKEMEIDSAQK